MHAVDVKAVAALLAPLAAAEALTGCFLTMKCADQHHGLDVALDLMQQGYTEPDLMAAALLHDVGKTRASSGLLSRVWVVLVEHYVPSAARRWSSWEEGRPLPRGLRRGFVVRRYHAEWGADIAAAAGAPPRTVAWIRRHHAPAGDDAALRALQRADEA